MKIKSSKGDGEREHLLDPRKTKNSSLKSDPERWKKFWTRFWWGAAMIAVFAVTIAAGHYWTVLLVIGIQTAVFREVIAIAHPPNKERKLPWFRTQQWIFLLCSYYFLYGEMLLHFFRGRILADPFLAPLAIHHRIISFGFYISGLVFFVLNLKKGHYRFQFNQFGLIHMTLMLVVFQAQFVIRNIFNGLIWFLLPVTLVIWNDIMAYFFGFFFGRTPLIKISPKKTWEGFMGAFVSTIIFAFFMSRLMSQYPFLTCPANPSLPKIDSLSKLLFDLSQASQRLANLLISVFKVFGIVKWIPNVILEHANQYIGSTCKVKPLFNELCSYPIPTFLLQRLMSLLMLRAQNTNHSINQTSTHAFSLEMFSLNDGVWFINVYPIQLHALVISVFVALVAPFGGFFASGFKRAFKVKDFASSIPGHGGITDRMDCQFIAGFFVYLYYASFLHQTPFTPEIFLQKAIRQFSRTDLETLESLLKSYLSS